MPRRLAARSTERALHEGGRVGPSRVIEPRADSGCREAKFGAVCYSVARARDAGRIAGYARGDLRDESCGAGASRESRRSWAPVWKRNGGSLKSGQRAGQRCV